MDQSSTFADVLEAVERLSVDEQEALVEIVRRRAAEQGRKRVAAEAAEARREFEAGRSRPTTPDDLMDEILS